MLPASTSASPARPPTSWRGDVAWEMLAVATSVIAKPTNSRAIPKARNVEGGVIESECELGSWLADGVRGEADRAAAIGLRGDARHAGQIPPTRGDSIRPQAEQGVMAIPLEGWNAIV